MGILFIEIGFKQVRSKEMKKVRFSFILIASFSWLLTSSNLVFAEECEGAGKPNGSECHFEECECASEVCYNGKCAECAIDSDCQDGQNCVTNNCQ